MAPKKKGGDEKAPPKPEELLPKGFGINSTVFWCGYPEKIGEGPSFMVRPGFKGQLVAVPDMIEFDQEDGEKGYAVEVVEVSFDRQPEPQKVPLKSLTLKPPGREAMWNMKPVLSRKFVKVVLPATTSNKSGLSTGRRSPSPSAKKSPPLTQDAEKAVSPFIQALSILKFNTHRADKVEHMLTPSLVEFLNNSDFHYSSNSLGNHSESGWVDWRAVYPWVVEVVKEANLQGALSPQLSIDADIYEALVKKFDKQAGQFMNQCPRTETLLPFGKFVVATLYLESQEEIRKRLEMEAQMKELVEKECKQDGSPWFAALWDTDDDLDLRVGLPEDFGEINFRQQFVEDGTDMQPSADEEDGQATLSRPVAIISWAVFDPQATGEDTSLCPPVGQYSIWLHMAARRSKLPCHWACRAVIAGDSQIFGGTWNDGDGEFIQVATLEFSEPTFNFPD